MIGVVLDILPEEVNERWNNHLKFALKKHNPTLINTKKQLHLADKCKVFVFYGYAHQNYYKKSIRPEIIKIAESKNLPIIYIEAGIFQDRLKNDPDKVGENGKRIFTVTVNGCKRSGLGYLDLINKTENNKFFTQYKKEIGIMPGDHVYSSILIHNIWGYASNKQTEDQQIRLITEKVEEIKSKFDNILISNHPLSEEKTLTLNKLLKNSKYAFGWHTNTICWCVLKGIPSWSFDEDNFAYDLCSHNLDEIKYCSIESVEKWLFNVCHSQFNLRDIRTSERFKNILEILI